MNGKGDKQRPTDLKKFGKNYDKAFDRDELIDNITKSIDVDFDNDTGAIKIRNSDGIETREKKINIIKEYVDINNVEMVIVNIDDSLTNKVMTKRQLKTLRHELINEEVHEAEQDTI